VIKTSRMSNLTCFLRELSPAKRRGSGLIRNLCWLLVASVSQNGPVRIPHAVFCSLPIPQRKSTISNIDTQIFTKGKGHCAWDSHDRHMGNTLLFSVAAPPVMAT